MSSPSTGNAAPGGLGRASDALRRIARLWPTWIVVAVALWVIWPIPIGKMPLSQDHTVHLGRTWIWHEQLRSGHLSGWSSYWFFGFPVGELYPILCDFVIIAVRWATFGLLAWPKCYAVAFTGAYVAHGLVLIRIARAAGLGPVPGVLAAVLTFLDPGVLREGGWAYTVYYGVWLQPMAAALIWWAFAETYVLIGAEGPLQPRRLVLPAVAVALALQCHSIAIPMLAFMAVLFVVLVGVRGALSRTAAATLTMAVIGACVAAWWLVPQISHRHWMSNYGTLYSDLTTMFSRVGGGVWAKHMAPPVGFVITAGLVWCLVFGTRFARFMAVSAVGLWMMASSDIFYGFRLDWLSDSARYLQYQRFIICAKPGLFIAAGAVLVAIVRHGLAPWTAGGRDRKTVARLALCVVLGGAGGLAVVASAWTTAKANGVGKVRTIRNNDKKFDRDVDAFFKWSANHWADRDGFYRFAYKAKRHTHVYLDAPVYNGAPSYKIGFTPGDVYMHKPESEQAAVLDRLRVRYVVTTQSTGRKTKPIKKFGKVKVFERPETDEQIARLVGGGEIEVLEDDPDHGRVVVRVSGATEESRLEFNISGYPRWLLEHDGTPVDWYEVPVVGKAEPITQEDRRAGRRRSTGTGLSPPPNDPMLIAIDAQDGTYVLRYRHWVRADFIGWAAALTGLGLLGLMLARPARAKLLLQRLEARLGGLALGIVGGALAALLLVRWGSGFLAESSQAVGWLRVGKADDVVGLRNGPIKVERMLGPAILVRADKGEVARAVFPDVAVHGDTIEGWVAVDDGDLRDARNGCDLVVGGRAAGSEDEWLQLAKHAVRGQAGKQMLTIPISELGAPERMDLEVTVECRKGKAPRMGFDFELD